MAEALIALGGALVFAAVLIPVWIYFLERGDR